MTNDETPLQVYSALSANLKLLQETRFRLLTVLPAATVGALALITGSAGIDGREQALIGGLGAIITLALYMYDVRNSALIESMRANGEQLEKQLGVIIGQFVRVDAPKRKVLAIVPAAHREALHMIYLACLVAWIIVAITGCMCWSSVADCSHPVY